jgi:hypothetical protein
MIYLTLPELLRIAERVIEGEINVRDYGLLESASGAVDDVDDVDDIAGTRSGLSLGREANAARTGTI